MILQISNKSVLSKTVYAYRSTAIGMGMSGAFYFDIVVHFHNVHLVVFIKTLIFMQY
jgi:hypothetical protein